MSKLLIPLTLLGVVVLAYCFSWWIIPMSCVLYITAGTLFIRFTSFDARHGVYENGWLDSVVATIVLPYFMVRDHIKKLSTPTANV